MNASAKHAIRAGVISAGISVAAFVVCWSANSAGWMQELELWFFDRWLCLQSKSPHQPPITIVAMTEADVQNMPHYPLTDRDMAEIITAILRHQPRVIGIDIYRDKEVPPGRPELDAVLRDNPNVVMIMKYEPEPKLRSLPPAVIADDPDRFGFSDMVLDPDDVVVRRALLFIEDNLASLAFTVATHYLDDDDIALAPVEGDPEAMQLGQATFRALKPDDGLYVNVDAAGYQILLDYRTARTFPAISLGKLREGAFDPGLIRDRVILIGAHASSVKDEFRTPRNAATYGVDVHGMIVDQLIRAALHGDKPVGFVPNHVEAGWPLLWALLGGALGFAVRSPWRLAAAVCAGQAALLGATYALFCAGAWLPAASTTASWLGSAALVTAYMAYRERNDRVAIFGLFGQHVSDDVAQTIWNSRDEILEDGRLRSQDVMVTVLFTDLVGFTPIAEKRTPGEVMTWLNDYMEIMSAIVIDNGGMVNKYIGDSIMAVFGAPLISHGRESIARDAAGAVRCALTMRRRIIELNRVWEGQGLPTVGMRVGIHSGHAVAGSLGSRTRLEYTVIGDTVNTASRLESFDKTIMDADIAAGNCRILISQATLTLLDDGFNVRHVADVALKGRSDPLTLFGVIGETGQSIEITSSKELSVA